MLDKEAGFYSLFIRIGSCLADPGHSLWLPAFLSFLFSLFVQLRTCIDPITGLEIPFTPHGRFIHVPPACPSTKWATDFGRPWWKDTRYLVGRLSTRTRLVKITNMLSSESQTLEVSPGRGSVIDRLCTHTCWLISTLPSTSFPSVHHVANALDLRRGGAGTGAGKIRSVQ